MKSFLKGCLSLVLGLVVGLGAVAVIMATLIGLNILVLAVRGLLVDFVGIDPGTLVTSLLIGLVPLGLLVLITSEFTEEDDQVETLKEISEEEVPEADDELVVDAVESQAPRESVSEWGTGAGWLYVASRAVGSGHVKRDMPCQDCYFCQINDAGWLVIAVADGAGSAKFSHVGARLAVETAARSLKNYDGAAHGDIEPALREACEESRTRILDEASNMEAKPRDLACTFLLVLAGPNGSGAAHIGDGVIASRYDGRDWDWVFWPDHGEYINTTRFLTDNDAFERMRFMSSPEIPSEVAAMTDGLEYLALDFGSKSVFSPFFEGVIDPVKSAHTADERDQIANDLGKWLGSHGLAERVDDDLTLVLAVGEPRS